MLNYILILHLLGATIWAGEHLISTLNKSTVITEYAPMPSNPYIQNWDILIMQPNSKSQTTFTLTI